MKIKSYVVSVLTIGMVLFVFLAFSPVPKSIPENCEIVSGQLVDVFGVDENQDVVFQLDGDDNIYYINRGLENGVDPSLLMDELIYRDINIHYVKHWSPLSALTGNSLKHIAKIEIDGTEIYSEMVES